MDKHDREYKEYLLVEKMLECAYEKRRANYENVPEYMKKEIRNAVSKLRFIRQHYTAGSKNYTSQIQHPQYKDYATLNVPEKYPSARSLQEAEKIIKDLVDYNHDDEQYHDKMDDINFRYYMQMGLIAGMIGISFAYLHENRFRADDYFEYTTDHAMDDFDEYFECTNEEYRQACGIVL